MENGQLVGGYTIRLQYARASLEEKALTESCSRRFGSVTQSGKTENRPMTNHNTPPFEPTTSAATLRQETAGGARRFKRGRSRRNSCVRSRMRRSGTSSGSRGSRAQGITDGEFRRTYFHIDFLEQLEGVETRGDSATSTARAAR